MNSAAGEYGGVKLLEEAWNHQVESIWNHRAKCPETTEQILST